MYNIKYIACKKYIRRGRENSIKKAGLPPEKVWFCGDNPKADVEGAAKAGFFPVWYDNDLSDLDTGGKSHTPQCEHLRVNNRSEMIKIPDKL